MSPSWYESEFFLALASLVLVFLLPVSLLGLLPVSLLFLLSLGAVKMAPVCAATWRSRACLSPPATLYKLLFAGDAPAVAVAPFAVDTDTKLAPGV